MRIVLTGGHVTPAIALVPFLRKKHTLLFIVRKYAYEGDSGPSFEYKAIKELGVAHRVITAGRLQRSFTLYTIPSLLKFPVGFIQSFSILISFRPHVVLSFGGYVALPVSLAGFLLGIPIVTHEQAVKIGLANKITALFAKKICVSFKESLRYVQKNKAVLTGNPIRKELFGPPGKVPFAIAQRELPIIYITGGSGGSRSINMLIAQVLDQLLAKYTVIHQTGKHDDDMLEKKAKMLPPILRERYIHKSHVGALELAFMYAHAALLVGRCGANTVYEILAFGLPALLIPLPWAGASEQEANARLVEKVGLGRVVVQEGLAAHTLLATIDEMVSQNVRYKRNKQKAQQVVIFDAQEKIIDVLEAVGRV